MDWARDHRMHHKYSETDADPHNASRGFFFSHIGWLLVRKHPELTKKGKGLDLSDLRSDKILMFQKKWVQKSFKYFCQVCLFFIGNNEVFWYFYIYYFFGIILKHLVYYNDGVKSFRKFWISRDFFYFLINLNCNSFLKHGSVRFCFDQKYRKGSNFCHTKLKTNYKEKWHIAMPFAHFSAENVYIFLNSVFYG